MQFCQDHWYELKMAIWQRGMGSLAADRATGIRNTGQELQGPHAQQHRDPLMMTSSMISEQALMVFGTDLLSHHCCPLCEVELNLGRGLSFEWINFDADMILELCRERRWIESEQ